MVWSIQHCAENDIKLLFELYFELNSQYAVQKSMQRCTNSAVAHPEQP